MEAILAIGAKWKEAMFERRKERKKMGKSWNGQTKSIVLERLVSANKLFQRICGLVMFAEPFSD
jgi:hypothetical protein